ncbi:X-box-binding protein 1 isoform X1 [Opisthocomus hoazin]|uniref:X-box-binding protein 1 isoform X1 n=1 Tax=Opisthocomus hoazin TaxID=30419 RepID=UPI003F52EB0C
MPSRPMRKSHDGRNPGGAAGGAGGCGPRCRQAVASRSVGTGHGSAAWCRSPPTAPHAQQSGRAPWPRSRPASFCCPASRSRPRTRGPGGAAAGPQAAAAHPPEPGGKGAAQVSGGCPRGRAALRAALTAAVPRRKLKNRVAAQSARDRKKARMTELEQQVVELEEENQKLLLENQLLREKTCSLFLENQELRCRLGLDALKTEGESESEAVKESQVDEIRVVTGSAESAALRLRVPLQQVQAQQSLFLITFTWILMAVTLQTQSLISSWAFWTVWTQRCFSNMMIQSQCAWKSWRKRSVEKQIPYQPPPLHLWGPHQLSWRPLMN